MTKRVDMTEERRDQLSDYFDGEFRQGVHDAKAVTYERLDQVMDLIAKQGIEIDKYARLAEELAGELMACMRDLHVIRCKNDDFEKAYEESKALAKFRSAVRFP